MISKENFAPTDFSLPEQFKLNYMVSGYQHVHNQTSGSNKPSKKILMSRANNRNTADLQVLEQYQCRQSYFFGFELLNIIL